MKHSIAALVLALAACSDVTYVIVTLDVSPDIEEYAQLSAHTRLLALGSHRDSLNTVIEVSEDDLAGFTFSLEGQPGDTATLWVEARDVQGTALARGSTEIEFRNKTGGETVTLALTCSGFDDCDDNLFCNGEEVCFEGTCVSSGAPCESPHPCALSSCDEDNDRCDVTLDHTACLPGQSCNPYLGCRRCDVLPYSTFCRPGEICVSDSAQPEYGECVTQAGWWCDAVDCGPCDTVARCGPGCQPCSPPASECGGEEIGCVLSGCAGAPDGTVCRVVTDPDRGHDFCQGGVCITPGSAVYADGVDRSGACAAGAGPDEWICTASRPRIPLGDTGQRECFDITNTISCSSQAVLCVPAVGSYCGQDSQHGWDASHAAEERLTRRQLVPDEPVVEDRVTGLEWQGCMAGRRGDDCSVGGGAEFTWTNAFLHCDDLTWGGHSDWRLPDRFELRSILTHASSGTTDPMAFPGVRPNAVWTSSANFHPINPQSEAWYVNFSDGETQSGLRTWARSVRCVRAGGRVVSGPRFVRTEPVADEPVVDDGVTGLLWQGCPGGMRDPQCSTTEHGNFGGWSQALAYCRSLDWGGYADWRLPNIVELDSLVDPSQDGAVPYDTVAFPGTEVWDEVSEANAIWYVSSTTQVLASGAANDVYILRFDYGFIGVLPKAQPNAALIRCVRGP